MQVWIEMEDHAMSLIRNGYAVFGRPGFLGLLFSAFLALALFNNRATTAQEVKQIKLTEKQIQSFMAAYEDIAGEDWKCSLLRAAANVHIENFQEPHNIAAAFPDYKFEPAR